MASRVVSGASQYSSERSTSVAYSLAPQPRGIISIVQDSITPSARCSMSAPGLARHLQLSHSTV